MDSSRNRFRSSRIRRLLSGLLVTLLVVAAVEIALRIASPASFAQLRQRTFRVPPLAQSYVTLQKPNFDPATGRALLVYDSALFWVMQPEMRGTFWSTPDVRTNALGLRSGSVASKASRTLRLLFVGDSTTFGFGVSEEDRFGEGVAASLRERHPDRTWDAVNAGVVGYSSFQGARFLDRRLDDLEPDAVFFSFGVNDAFKEVMSDAERWERARRPGARLLFSLRRTQIFAGLEILGAYGRREYKRFAGRSREKPRIPQHTYFYYAERRYTPKRPRVHRNDADAFVANHADALDRCARAGIPFVVVGQAFEAPRDPNSIPNLDIPQIGRNREGLRAWCDAREVPYVDIAGRFAASGLPTDDLLLDLCHPTAVGHAIVAEAIAEFLEGRGILPILLE